MSYSAKLLRRPFVFRDRFGLKITLYPNEHLYPYFYNKGHYEVAEQNFCAHYLCAGMTSFDVGAHVGWYTLLFAKLVQQSGAVHSFEAERDNYERLVHNVAKNGFSNVHAHHLAVFSRRGVVTLNVFEDERITGAHTLGRAVIPDPDNPDRVLRPSARRDVRSISMDDYCYRTDIGAIDLMKIDVEGAELDVMEGSQRLLSEKRIGCILFEVSKVMVEGMGRTGQETFQFLKDCGYVVYRLSEDGRLLGKVATSNAFYANFVAVPSPTVVSRCF